MKSVLFITVVNKQDEDSVMRAFAQKLLEIIMILEIFLTFRNLLSKIDLTKVKVTFKDAVDAKTGDTPKSVIYAEAYRIMSGKTVIGYGINFFANNIEDVNEHAVNMLEEYFHIYQWKNYPNQSPADMEFQAKMFDAYIWTMHRIRSGYYDDTFKPFWLYYAIPSDATFDAAVNKLQKDFSDDYKNLNPTKNHNKHHAVINSLKE